MAGPPFKSWKPTMDHLNLKVKNQGKCLGEANITGGDPGNRTMKFYGGRPPNPCYSVHSVHNCHHCNQQPTNPLISITRMKIIRALEKGTTVDALEKRINDYFQDKQATQPYQKLKWLSKTLAREAEGYNKRKERAVASASSRKQKKMRLNNACSNNNQ